jgi:ABC-type branched-subunit amino acid transport system ATPase component
MPGCAKRILVRNDMGTVLEVKNVCAGYGKVAVLRDVSLHVGEAESVAIIGANGAGKSTLVRAICGLISCSAGTIAKNTVDLTGMAAHERARQGIAVVLEGRHLFGELSVRNHLDLALISGRAAQTNNFSVTDVIEMFPFLRERMDAPVEVLSGGEQQMVAIARALLLQPALLILDEPSTGLAPKVVKEIVAVIATLRSRGMSIILVEQNAALAATITERAYVMSLGRVVHEVATGEWRQFLGDEKLAQSYLAGGN